MVELVREPEGVQKSRRKQMVETFQSQSSTSLMPEDSSTRIDRLSLVNNRRRSRRVVEILSVVFVRSQETTAIIIPGTGLAHYHVKLRSSGKRRSGVFSVKLLAQNRANWLYTARSVKQNGLKSEVKLEYKSPVSTNKLQNKTYRSVGGASVNDGVSKRGLAKSTVSSRYKQITTGSKTGSFQASSNREARIVGISIRPVSTKVESWDDEDVQDLQKNDQTKTHRYVRKQTMYLVVCEFGGTNLPNLQTMFFMKLKVQRFKRWPSANFHSTLSFRYTNLEAQFTQFGTTGTSKGTEIIVLNVSSSTFKNLGTHSANQVSVTQKRREPVRGSIVGQPAGPVTSSSNTELRNRHFISSSYRSVVRRQQQRQRLVRPFRPHFGNRHGGAIKSSSVGIRPKVVQINLIQFKSSSKVENGDGSTYKFLVRSKLTKDERSKLKLTAAKKSKKLGAKTSKAIGSNEKSVSIRIIQGGKSKVSTLIFRNEVSQRGSIHQMTQSERVLAKTRIRRVWRVHFIPTHCQGVGAPIGTIGHLNANHYLKTKNSYNLKILNLPSKGGMVAAAEGVGGTKSKVDLKLKLVFKQGKPAQTVISKKSDLPSDRQNACVQTDVFSKSPNRSILETFYPSRQSQGAIGQSKDLEQTGSTRYRNRLENRVKRSNKTRQGFQTAELGGLKRKVVKTAKTSKLKSNTGVVTSKLHLEKLKVTIPMRMLERTKGRNQTLSSTDVRFGNLKSSFKSSTKTMKTSLRFQFASPKTRKHASKSKVTRQRPENQNSTNLWICEFKPNGSTHTVPKVLRNPFSQNRTSAEFSSSTKTMKFKSSTKTMDKGSEVQFAKPTIRKQAIWGKETNGQKFANQNYQKQISGKTRAQNPLSFSKVAKVSLWSKTKVSLKVSKTFNFSASFPFLYKPDWTWGYSEKGQVSVLNLVSTLIGRARIRVETARSLVETKVHAGASDSWTPPPAHAHPTQNNDSPAPGDPKTPQINQLAQSKGKVTPHKSLTKTQKLFREMRNSVKSRFELVNPTPEDVLKKTRELMKSSQCPIQLLKSHQKTSEFKASSQTFQLLQQAADLQQKLHDQRKDQTKRDETLKEALLLVQKSKYQSDESYQNWNRRRLVLPKLVLSLLYQPILDVWVITSKFLIASADCLALGMDPITEDPIIQDHLNESTSSSDQSVENQPVTPVNKLPKPVHPPVGIQQVKKRETRVTPPSAKRRCFKSPSVSPKSPIIPSAGGIRAIQLSTKKTRKRRKLRIQKSLSILEDSQPSEATPKPAGAQTSDEMPQLTSFYQPDDSVATTLQF